MPCPALPALPTPLACTVRPTDPASPVAQALMDTLSQRLAELTGDSGRSGFAVEDLQVPRACLVIAWDAHGQPLGCGALRPLNGGRGHGVAEGVGEGSDDVGELKRMLALHPGSGVGRALLADLEARARAWGYRALCLSTRRINRPAVAFYQACGYVECAPYGRYIGRADSICLDKSLT